MTQPNLFDASPSQPTPLEMARRRLEDAIEWLTDSQLDYANTHDIRDKREVQICAEEVAMARMEVARLEKAEIERRKA